MSLRPYQRYRGSLSQLSPECNAFTFTFDESALGELRHEYQRLIAPALAEPSNQALLEGQAAYFQPFIADYFAVTYGVHPLLWVSCNQERTYGVFQRFYDKLGVDAELRRLIDHRDHLVLSCGFYVIGNRAPEAVWHYDYMPGANCYTILTPLFELAPRHGQLWYRNRHKEVETYAYKLGEAVAFGDHFKHTTQPYEPSESLRVVLSLQVSTDKMEHWPQLRKTIASQSSYLKLPCGHLLGTCKCQTTVAGGPPAFAAAVRSCAATLANAKALDVPTTLRIEPCPCGSGKKYKKCHGAQTRHV